MNGIFEKLGARAYALPLAIVIAIACVMSLAFFPMTHMEPKNLPFAILALDAGAATPQGDMNAGEALAEAMASQQSETDGDAAIAWTRIETQDELDRALENNEYYGAMIIPEDFTASQIAAQAAAMASAGAAGATEATADDAQAAALAAQAMATGNASADALVGTADAAGDVQAASTAASTATAATVDGQSPQSASITVIIDNAKSPLVATMMQQTMASMFSEQGVAAEIEIIHAGEADKAESTDEGATMGTNAMGTMMSQQISIMPLFIMSAICGLIITRIVRLGASETIVGRFKAAGIQAALVAAFSLIVALAVYCIATFVGGADLPFADATLFFWLASLGIMAAVMGLADLALPLGALGILLAFSGMACGMMPPEMLPAFWQDWICPWAPQGFIGQGVRAILYMGAGAWNVGSLPLAITGIVGIALMVVAACIPRKAAKAKQPQTAGA